MISFYVTAALLVAVGALSGAGFAQGALPNDKFNLTLDTNNCNIIVTSCVTSSRTLGWKLVRSYNPGWLLPRGPPAALPPACAVVPAPLLPKFCTSYPPGTRPDTLLSNLHPPLPGACQLCVVVHKGIGGLGSPPDNCTLLAQLATEFFRDPQVGCVHVHLRAPACVLAWWW